MIGASLAMIDCNLGGTLAKSVTKFAGMSIEPHVSET